MATRLIGKSHDYLLSEPIGLVTIIHKNIVYFWKTIRQQWHNPSTLFTLAWVLLYCGCGKQYAVMHLGNLKVATIWGATGRVVNSTSRQGLIVVFDTFPSKFCWREYHFFFTIMSCALRTRYFVSQLLFLLVWKSWLFINKKRHHLDYESHNWI